MRRNMDLVRELLLKLEAMPVRPGSLVSYNVEDLRVDGFSDEEIEDHLLKLYRAGFIDSGSDVYGPQSGRSFYYRDLTWSGHDFVSSVREPKVWSETKSRAEKVGSWSIDLLAGLAKGYAKAKAAELGFPIG